MQLLSVAVYLYEGYFFGTIAIASFKRHYFLDTMMRPVMVGIFVVLTGLCLWSMFGREGLTCRDASWLTFICAQWYEISKNCIRILKLQMRLYVLIEIPLGSNHARIFIDSFLGDSFRCTTPGPSPSSSSSSAASLCANST
jgi:hypothetical protein